MKWIIKILCLFSFLEFSAQVAYISGSYSTATASGSGASGIPTLSYTPSAGTNRLLVFFMAAERDHKPAANGDNWASGAPTGGSVPTVEINSTALINLNSTWRYFYETTATETDAELSIELMVYGLLEASIPSGTYNFTLTGNYSTPASAGDEAIFGAMMFNNVAGMSHIVDANCELCNSISTSNVSPNDGNNAVLAISAASSDRTYTQGSGYTLLGTNSVSNSNGTWTDASYSELDGMAAASQYRTGTVANQTSPFTLSGSANTVGVIESAYRIVSTNLLPVDFISFEVEHSENGNLLKWSTGLEINNKEFQIQRSSTGFEWEQIGVVQGNGNSEYRIDYEYLDEMYDCEKCFYRLKQVDFDGEHGYSPIRMLNLNTNNGYVNIYPSHSNRRINIISDKVTIERVLLKDLNGKTVFTSGLTDTKNYFIQRNELKEGLYFIMVQTNQGVKSQKVYLK